MKGLAFDLDKRGIETVFKPYQSELMILLHETGHLTSGEAYKGLVKNKISRASIIFFLNYMVDEGFLTSDKESGKGGFHRVYRPTLPTYTAFIRAVYETFMDRLKTDLLGVIEDV